MLKNKKIRVIVVVILSLFLIGRTSMAIIKGVEHLRIEKQKRQKAESIKESKKEAQDQAKARQNDRDRENIYVWNFRIRWTKHISYYK